MKKGHRCRLNRPSPPRGPGWESAGAGEVVTTPWQRAFVSPHPEPLRASRRRSFTAPGYRRMERLVWACRDQTCGLVVWGSPAAILNSWKAGLIRARCAWMHYFLLECGIKLPMHTRTALGALRRVQSPARVLMGPCASLWFPPVTGDGSGSMRSQITFVKVRTGEIKAEVTTRGGARKVRCPISRQEC